MTDDGSSTIFLPDHDEYYHSKHGAISESEHIFIKNGLFFWKKKIRIINAVISLRLDLVQV